MSGYQQHLPGTPAVVTSSGYPLPSPVAAPRGVHGCPQLLLDTSEVIRFAARISRVSLARSSCYQQQCPDWLPCVCLFAKSPVVRCRCPADEFTAPRATPEGCRFVEPPSLQICGRFCDLRKTQRGGRNVFEKHLFPQWNVRVFCVVPNNTTWKHEHFDNELVPRCCFRVLFFVMYYNNNVGTHMFLQCTGFHDVILC